MAFLRPFVTEVMVTMLVFEFCIGFVAGYSLQRRANR